MTKRKSTKSALISSILALFLCFTMLLGTTLAWFTDSVTSGNNIIKPGNLDVTLEYWDGSDWADVEGATDILTNELWEPGVTEVAYLRVANAGSLALKYQLGINILTNELAGKNQKGETFLLSDYLLFGVVEGVNGETGAYPKDDAGRAAAIAAVTDAKKISAGYTKAATMQAGEPALYFALVVYMPTDTDDKANHNGTDIPQIDLGINVVATQLSSEKDSFDEYYDGAANWLGGVDYSWYDPFATEYTLGTAEQLAGLAAIVNGTAPNPLTRGGNATYQDSFAGKTIKLASDMDLKNLPWTPIGNWDNTFAGTFDGNGHTIYNLYINDPEGEGVGFFGVTQNATIKGITLENVNISAYSMVAGLAGAAYPANISDCHITGDVEIVAEWAYVAGIAGYCYYGTQVDDCSVIAEDTGLISSLTRNAVGGITAWLLEGNHKVTNCTVKNLELTGWTNVGGITGFIHYNNTIEGCSVENVTLTKTRQDGNPGIGLIAGGWSYNASNAITLRNNTVKNATVEGTHIAYDAYNELYGSEYGGATTTNFVLENNNTENITNNLIVVKKITDTDELKDALTNDATVYLPEGEYALPTMKDKEGITIIGAADGSTVVGGENTSTGFGSSNFGKNTTIQNVTFTGTSNGVRWSYAQGGTSTFDNCTFAGDSTYGFHIDSSNGATFIFNDCTFIGFNAFAGDLAKVIFNNCTFLSNGNYGHTNIWSVAEFNNCTWGDKTSVGQGKDSGAKLYFNGVEESYHHEFIGSAESLLDFAKSVNEGGDSWKNQKVILVADINLENKAWTPIGQTGATEFKGIFDGQNYTIKNLYIDNSAATDEHTSSGLFGWAESGVTIQNVKVDGATVVGNHNVAVIVGYTYSSKIINCHVTNASIVCNHANGDACGDKCGLIVGYAGDESRITNCSASDSTVKAGRDAGQLVGCGYNVSMSNCTATNVTVTATGNCNEEKNINNAVIGRVMG